MSNRTIAILVGWAVMLVIGCLCVRAATRMANQMADRPTIEQQLAQLK